MYRMIKKTETSKLHGLIEELTRVKIRQIINTIITDLFHVDFDFLQSTGDVRQGVGRNVGLMKGRSFGISK